MFSIFLLPLNISLSEMLDDGSAAFNTLLLFEITTDDQTQREEQAGRQQAAVGELEIFCIKQTSIIFPLPPPFHMITSDSTSPPQ